eukprot:1860178-Rhodomonas_salina.1
MGCSEKERQHGRTLRTQPHTLPQPKKSHPQCVSSSCESWPDELGAVVCLPVFVGFPAPL